MPEPKSLTLDTHAGPLFFCLGMYNSHRDLTINVPAYPLVFEYDYDQIIDFTKKVNDLWPPRRTPFFSVPAGDCNTYPGKKTGSCDLGSAS